MDLLRYKYPNGIEDEAVIAVIMRSALHGLSYLHANQQLHRDIKSANILLSPDGRVQLADFGVAAALDAHDQRRTTFVGTVCYMAPEVLDPSETGGYDVKADSWSLGITAIELAYGKPPYALNQPMKVIMLLMKHPSPSLEVPEHDAKTLQLKPGRPAFSGAFKHFVDLCLQKDPKKRPTAQQLLEHSFFKNLPSDEAVCSAYLAKNVLAGLPSVGERYRQHAAKTRHASISSSGGVMAASSSSAALAPSSSSSTSTTATATATSTSSSSTSSSTPSSSPSVSFANAGANNNSNNNAATSSTANAANTGASSASKSSTKNGTPSKTTNNNKDDDDEEWDFTEEKEVDF